VETTSKYKGVAYAGRIKGKGHAFWKAQYENAQSGMNWEKLTKTERQAALEYDKKMLELGKEPVNILKPK
jgi:hypothetical protein